MELIIYAANAGDRNDRAMRGAMSLGSSIAQQLDVEARTVGSPTAPVEGGWAKQLEAASPNLRLLAQSVDGHFEDGHRIILAMGRCAASLATLPLVATRFPDVAIVWFDAHGDCNQPIADDNYLGGMVLTGAAGEWHTGLGDGLDLTNVILVGARDLDPPEQARIEAGEIGLVSVGPGLSRRLEEAIGGRRVYVHLDCDVLSAGLIATEYQSPEGLSFLDLRDAFETLANHDVLGLEITEYEACWSDGRPNRPGELLAAIRPVTHKLKSGSVRLHG